MLLNVENLNAFYGKSQITFDINLYVDKGETVAIVGRNGVGKTTILKSIISLVDKTGKVTFKNMDITNLPTYKICKSGIGFVPDYGGVFLDLTVEENFKLIKSKEGKFSFDYITQIFPQIVDLMKRKGGQLSGGERRLIGISRALIMNPELLIIDEPSEGLAPIIVKEIERIIVKLKEEGISILLADQHIKFILNVADRIYVVDNGVIKFVGNKKEISKDLLEKYVAV